MEQYIKIDFKKRQVIGANLKVLTFSDSGHFIHYMPSLKISAYGSTNEEAKEMLDVTMKEYVLELVKQPEYKIVEELSRYGWERQKLFKKKFSSSAYVDKEGILREFELPESTVIEETHLSVSL